MKSRLGDIVQNQLEGSSQVSPEITNQTIWPFSDFLLHDGRARTIEEAILWHGGEGEHVYWLFIGKYSLLST